VGFWGRSVRLGAVICRRRRGVRFRGGGVGLWEEVRLWGRSVRFFSWTIWDVRRTVFFRLRFVLFRSEWEGAVGGCCLGLRLHCLLDGGFNRGGDGIVW